MSTGISVMGNPPALPGDSIGLTFAAIVPIHSP